MAELVVYAYNGPGEQEAAETLAEGLDGGWVVIAGRALPTPQKDDVDLLVVGQNRIFAVEVKHWGPTIDVLNGGWRVKGEIRASPVGRNAQVARITATVLKKVIGGYASAASGAHLVQPKIVLTHPKLDLHTSEYPYDDDQILMLDEAAKALQAADATPTGFHDVREKVIDFLSGLAARQEAPTKLGPFTVDMEVESVGRSRVFVGKDRDGDPAVLRAYPLDGWGPGVRASHLVRHERIATKRIAQLNRSWSVEASFDDDARRWIVLPIRPTPSVALSRHAAAGQIPVLDPVGHLTDRARHIVTDAFQALAETHQMGVVHRGLMPSRVLLAKNDRVLFRDFYLAHADEEATIVAQIADAVDGSVPFRAPEVMLHVGNASPASDVYSLALSLRWWINGDVTLLAPDEVRALASRDLDFGPLGPVLASCLSEKPAARPTAATVVEILQGILDSEAEPAPADVSSPAPESSGFVEGGRVGDNGRYRLQRQLGHGGFATSWLAIDDKTGAARVIKQYSLADSTWQVKAEFEAAAKLASPRCARVWDYSPTAPVFLVSDYVDGQSLKDFGEAGAATEEDYRQVALDALEGLAYMHSEDQLHRDISPTNVIVRDDGRAVLIDFGLSAEARRAVSVAGTPPYIAPEVEATGAWTASADLYALGVTLLKVMLARYPYAGSGAEGFDKTKLRPLAAEEEETWGPGGVAILNALFRLVAPEPQHRPSSAAEFAEILRTVPAPPSPAGTRAINPTVANLRRLYRGSALGNAGNRGLDDDFARDTYVPTRLDTALTPDVVKGDLDVVLLTGNPGDGKTAFLATLRDHLQEAGASDAEAPTAGGWRMVLGERTFAAVYDASEARDGKTSDDLMHEALTAEGGPHTALIAVNDGRLISFFAENQDIYPDCYLAVQAHAAGRESDRPRVAIVDLKRRSLAPTGTADDGLAGAVLDTFTTDGLWAACESCTARRTCPILSNRNLLRTGGKRPLLELVEVSHLRRKRRATFRDVRSAFAWTITGDRGCKDVHEAIEDGRDLRRADNALAYDLAFDNGNPDYLVAEWALLDPSMLAAPDVERSIRDGSFGLDTTLRPASHHRQLFFDGDGASPVGRTEVRAYRYLDEFIDMLAGRIEAPRVRTTILRGLSRILGAHGYGGSALALRDGESDGWAVLREIDAEEFTVAPIPTFGAFVEQQPDGLRIEHRLGSMNLSLDSFELVRRAADGEILGDAGAEAVKLELLAFGDLLRRNPGRRVLVVDPAGQADAVTAVDGVITREGASA